MANFSQSNLLKTERKTKARAAICPKCNYSWCVSTRKYWREFSWSMIFDCPQCGNHFDLYIENCVDW